MKNEPTGDPRKGEPQPPFEGQPKQSIPGSDAKMEPQADHGELTYRGTGRLQDRVAIITGADSGIGRAVALAYAREGADVVVSYLEEDRDAEETGRLVTEAGRRVKLIRGDIGTESHCKEIVRQTLEEFDRLDVLVNNAAFQVVHESIQDFTAEEVERTFRTNIFGVFFLCKAALPHMKPGGCIINTCSIQAVRPSPMLLSYSPTKAAVVNFTKGLAKQVMKDGIRVNAVAPGPVWTPLIPSTFEAEQFQHFGEGNLLGRPAQPAELAPPFVWLASAEASYITGEVYGVTGGSTPV
jgi:hypothetical protein